MPTNDTHGAKKFRLTEVTVAAVLLMTASAQADVISWFSQSNALDGTAAPHVPQVLATGGDSGTLYIWAQNTVKLNSLAYDVISSDTSLVKVTGRRMYNPVVGGDYYDSVDSIYPFPLFPYEPREPDDGYHRWDAFGPSQGKIVGGNLQNMFGTAVVTHGLHPIVRAGDPGWDDWAQAALIAEIQYTIQSPTCTIDCMALPVALQLKDGVFGTFSPPGQEATTNHFATLHVNVPVGYALPTAVAPTGSPIPEPSPPTDTLVPDVNAPEPASLGLATLALLCLFNATRPRRSV
jgi:hypothetical protein